MDGPVQMGIARHVFRMFGMMGGRRLARLETPATLQVEKGEASLSLVLPRQAVSRVQLDW